MSQDKLMLIRQSLAAAESSVKTAKQLLSELESGGLRPSAKELPGEVGTFDGVNMVTEKGEKYEVPANYASKSMLVIGDTIKLVEEDGVKRFKQIEHVKRHKTLGILHKKDGKFKAITPEGSYNVLNAAVEHFNGDVGDEVVLHLPDNNLTVPFGAIESIAKKDASDLEEDTTVTPLLKEEVKIVAPAPIAQLKPVNKSPVVSPVRNQDASNKNKIKKSSGYTPAKPVLPAIAPKPAVVTAPSVLLPAPGEDDDLR